MGGGNIDQAKGGAPLRSRHDLTTSRGIDNALREIYPPNEAAELQFERLLGQLGGEPGCNVPTKFKGRDGLYF